MRFSLRQQTMSLLALTYNRDDSTAAKKVAKFRARSQSWRVDGLGDWCTEDIFQRLREMGIPVSSEDFRSAAFQVGHPYKLFMTWNAIPDPVNDERTSFLLLAAEELWERFAGDIPCPEMFCRKIEKCFLQSDTTLSAADELLAADAIFFAHDYVKYFTNLSEDQRLISLGFIDEHCLFPMDAILDNLFLFYQSYFYGQSEFLEKVLYIFGHILRAMGSDTCDERYLRLLSDNKTGEGGERLAHTAKKCLRPSVCE